MELVLRLSGSALIAHLKIRTVELIARFADCLWVKERFSPSFDISRSGEEWNSLIVISWCTTRDFESSKHRKMTWSFQRSHSKQSYVSTLFVCFSFAFTLALHFVFVV